MRVGFRSWQLVGMSLALSRHRARRWLRGEASARRGSDALAASTGTRLARACDHGDQDTSHYLHTPLYRACAVSVKARPVANDVRPEFRATGRDRSCFSAVIQLAVDTAGFPESRSVAS